MSLPVVARRIAAMTAGCMHTQPFSFVCECLLNFDLIK